MGVYFAWAVMTVMSSRVYLNLVLVVHGGRGRDGMTTGGLSTFRTARVDNPEGIEREAGHIETFGAKHINRRIPLTTFTTVGLDLLSFPSLPCIPYRRLPPYTLSRRLSAWNTTRGWMPNQTLWSEGVKALSLRTGLWCRIGRTRGLYRGFR